MKEGAQAVEGKEPIMNKVLDCGMRFTEGEDSLNYNLGVFLGFVVNSINVINTDCIRPLSSLNGKREMS